MSTSTNSLSKTDKAKHDKNREYQTRHRAQLQNEKECHIRGS